MTFADALVVGEFIAEADSDHLITPAAANALWHLLQARCPHWRLVRDEDGPRCEACQLARDPAPWT